MSNFQCVVCGGELSTGGTCVRCGHNKLSLTPLPSPIVMQPPLMLRVDPPVNPFTLGAPAIPAGQVLVSREELENLHVLKYALKQYLEWEAAGDSMNSSIAKFVWDQLKQAYEKAK